MPYVYEDNLQGRPHLGAEYQTPFSTVIDEARAAAYESTPTFGAVPRWWALHQDFNTGQTISADQARAKIAAAGLSDHLQVSDAGITEAALDTLIERKRNELKRGELLAGAAGGFWQSSAQLAAGFLTFGADPINIGLARFPVIGTARYLSWLANASKLGRVGIRTGVGALEGATGMAVIEPFVYAMHKQEQADYGMQNSLENVAFGALFGATMRGGFGTGAETFRALRHLEQPWERFKGLTADEVILAQNFREGFAEMTPAEAKRILDTWSPTARAAVSDLVHPEPGFAETLDHALSINATHAEIARTLTPDTLQTAIRLAIGQAVDGRPVNVRPLLAGEVARLPDGRMVADLAPERFTPVAERAPELLQNVEARTAALETERASLPSEAPLMRVARLDAEKRRLDAQREAVVALGTGKTLDAAQTEAVRQASVAHALELGIPVPETALRGMPAQLAKDARTLRTATTERALAKENAAPVEDPAWQAADEAANAMPPEPKEDLAQFEAEQAVAEMKAVTDKLGVEPDTAFVEEEAAIKNAERWARVAELATACLVRGD